MVVPHRDMLCSFVMGAALRAWPARLMINCNGAISSLNFQAHSKGRTPPGTSLCCCAHACLAVAGCCLLLNQANADLRGLQQPLLARRVAYLRRVITRRAVHKLHIAKVQDGGHGPEDGLAVCLWNSHSGHCVEGRLHATRCSSPQANPPLVVLEITLLPTLSPSKAAAQQLDQPHAARSAAASATAVIHSCA